MLVFDGDCAFCTSSARWMEDRLPDDVEVVAWQHTDLEVLGLSIDDVTRSAWFIDAWGHRHAAAEGIGKALATAGWPWRPLGWLAVYPPTAWIAEPAYRAIAVNRHRMPGGTPACALAQPSEPEGGSP
jgi:predicted DCC family thiol-disulfide oxidoreductase YuxK